MDLSFSDRLGNIMVLSYYLSYGSPLLTCARSTALAGMGIPTSEASAEARRLEDEVFAKASSTDDYRCSIDVLVAKIPHATAPGEGHVIPTQSDEILNLDGPDIGSYSCATFHKDGQMSTIFKAKAKNSSAQEQLVALKVTTPSAMPPPHDSIRESRLLVAAQHACIVPLLETFQQPGGRFVLVFPFLRQDLENLLRSAALTTRQSKMVLESLFRGLQHIHSLGMIHRDVKPSNILLRTMDGPAYLADFGIAWSPTDPDSESADAKIIDVGTTCYRPPELLFGWRKYDTSLDMWAAGCVVAELIRPDHTQVFDAGPIGSELSLVKSIFTTLGTPNTVTWPSASKYPDWGKMRFQNFPSKSWEVLLPGASQMAIELVGKTVCYEPTSRLTATEALSISELLNW